MSPLICSWGFESKLDILHSLHHSRLKLALFALVIQILVMFATLRPLAFTSLFNIPTILALLLCLYKPNLYDYESQKWIKLLLKIGIAKAIGGVCLAIFMGLKYVYLPKSLDVSSYPGEKQEGYLKFCALYFTASALIDIFCSFLSRELILKTKKIVWILKEKKKQRSPRSSKSGSPKAKLLDVMNQVQEP